MALISYVDDAVYQHRLRSPQVANLLRILFHSPAWAEAFVRLAGAQMNVLSLPAIDRELVILQTGHMLNSDYIVAQHEGISDLVGVTENQRDALLDQRVDDHAFSDRQHTLLLFVVSLVDRAFPNKDKLLDAKRFFTEAELVEIVGIQGFAATIAAITNTFQLEVDPVSGADLLSLSRRL